MELTLLTLFALSYPPTQQEIRDIRLQSGLNQAHEIQVNDYRRLIERNLFSKPINEQVIIRDLRPNSTGRIIIKDE